MASPQPAGPNALEQRLATLVEAYDRQGIHRSATDVDRAVGRVAGRLCARPGSPRHSRAVRPRPCRPAAVISTRRRSPHRRRASVRCGIYRPATASMAASALSAAMPRSRWPRPSRSPSWSRRRSSATASWPPGPAGTRPWSCSPAARGPGLYLLNALSFRRAVRSPDAASFKCGKRVAQGSCGGAHASDGRGRSDADRDKSLQCGREDFRSRS